MRLLEFVSLIRPLRGDGPLSREVNGVAWDARRVMPGNLFVALPGEGRDTQAAVDLAIERGASAVLCEGNEVVSLRATRIQVAGVRATMPRIAELFFGLPDRQLKVVGMLGSFSNSAAATLLKTVLDAAGFKCGIIGSTGCSVGERHLPPLRKNSELLDYHELLAQMVRAGCNACILEFTPEAIERKRFTDVAFDAVIFSDFSAQPVPGRGAALMQFCRAQAAGPKRFTAAFNIDDPISRALCESGVCAQQISFGFNAAAQVRGSNVELAHRSLGMVVSAPESEIRLRTKLTGWPNARHLLTACAAAVTLRIPLALTRFTLQKASIPAGSLEPVGEAQVYVDAAHTDEEVARALEGLREITRGRLLVAIGSPGGESFEARQQLGRVAAEFADHTVITTNNPGREAAIDIAAQVERGFANSTTYHIELDRAQAIDNLIRMMQPGDTALITGKGSETHQEFADTIVFFDDRQHAAAALEALAAEPPIPLPAQIAPVARPALAAVA